MKKLVEKPVENYDDLPLFKAAKTTKKASKKTKKSSKTLSTPRRNMADDHVRPIIKPESFKQEKLSKKQMDELMKIKSAVKKMERDNTNKIILFYSGPLWYKIAFRSNLIYKYRIIPYLTNVAFRSREDVDYYSFSDTGCTGVYDIIAFGDILKYFGAEMPESLAKYYDGSLPKNARPKPEELERIYVFKLDGITDANIETYYEQEFASEEDLNRLVMPAYLPQALYRDLHSFMERAVDAASRLPKQVQSTLGARMIDTAIDMSAKVTLACNGYGGHGKEDYIEVLKQIIAKSAVIQEIVRTLQDCRLVRMGACLDLTNKSLTVQADAEKELKMLARKDDSPANRIWERKSFPSLEGVDLSEELAKEEKL